MDEERRRFFRIDEEVMLAMQPIPPDQVDARLDDFWKNEHAYSIRNNYNFEIEQHIGDRQKIEKRMPELARYLRVLEKQIDQITEKLIIDDADKLLSRQHTNISAQGIAFCSDQSILPESLVELNLKLLPSGLRLVIIARVVKVEKETGQGEDGHRLSLDFEYMHEADREILIKHIHGKQMASLSSAQES